MPLAVMFAGEKAGVRNAAGEHCCGGVCGSCSWEDVAAVGGGPKDGTIGTICEGKRDCGFETEGAMLLLDRGGAPNDGASCNIGGPANVYTLGVVLVVLCGGGGKAYAIGCGRFAGKLGGGGSGKCMGGALILGENVWLFKYDGVEG